MRICVYGASRDEIDERYKQAVYELGIEIAKRGHSLVFGAGKTGLMGKVAEGVRDGGGKILGVLPHFFDDEVIFRDCTELIRTETMRERKQIMEDNADAFIMVPGGIGTYDEFFEMVTLRQLDRHSKPITILNTLGYYDTLLKFIDDTETKGFMRHPLYFLNVAQTPTEAIDLSEQNK